MPASTLYAVYIYMYLVPIVAIFPTGLLHYINHKDGQTLLHRAAEGCQSDNVTLLLRTDEKLANIQDKYGNTALQIACTKAHKATVKCFLVKRQKLFASISVLFVASSSFTLSH